MKKLRPLTSQDRVLILSPHPDDESLSTGGLIQVALEAGATVRVIYASNGDNNPWPQRVKERRFRIDSVDRFRWGNLRQKEAINALKHLGLTSEEDAEFLGFPDQGFNGALLNLDFQPLTALKSELENFKPTLLVTPSLHDQHPDHNSLAVFISRALEQIQHPVEELVYLVHTNGRTPLSDRVVLKLTPEQQERKRAAIAKHDSQMMLSRRRLLRFATPVETFYTPLPPEDDHDHHPVGSAYLTDDSIYIRIPADQMPRFPSKLFIAMESLAHGGSSWMLPVPRRSGPVKVRNVISGILEGEAYGELTDGDLNIQIPVIEQGPLTKLFIKIKSPTLFFDHTGWREVSVAPRLDREPPVSIGSARPQKSVKSSLAWIGFSFLMLLWLGAILTQNISSPWVNLVDFNGAVWSQAAHNILRAGLVQTEGASTGFYFGPLPIPPVGYYLHHPPLLHLMVTGLFVLFGEHEWVARLVPIACSLLSGIFLWLLVKNCAGVRSAAFSLGLFVCLPMELRYGCMVNFEPLLLMLILGALLCLRYWQTTRKTFWKAFAAGFLVLGLWVDWAMYLFVMVLCAYWFLKPNLKMRRMAVLLLASSLISAVLYLLRIQLLNPDALQSLAHAFVSRLGSTERIPFTQVEWFYKISQTIFTHFLPVSLLLSIAGCFAIYQKKFEYEGVRWLGWACLMVAIMDLIFVGGFQNDSYIHEYIAFYLIAPMAIMGGIGLNAMAASGEKRFPKQLVLRSIACVGFPSFLLLGSAYWGLKQNDDLQKQFLVLDFKLSEPHDLIPKLGEVIRSNFEPNTDVICNFLPVYGPHLGYYAQRNLLNNVSDYRHWQTFLKRPSKQDIGGVIWINSDKAREILSKLPSGRRRYFKFGKHSFCIWKPIKTTKELEKAKRESFGTHAYSQNPSEFAL